MDGLITLHLLAVPHTITNSRFPSQCAFNGKVLRFSPMIKTRPGFRVVHYGVETSESGADEEVTVLTYKRWQFLRVQSLTGMNPGMSVADAELALADPSKFVGDLANVGTPLYVEFNANVRRELLSRVDQSPGAHIVCLPFGRAHQPAVENTNFLCVETGIGYPDSFLDFRIFESSEWMHSNLGKGNGQNYWFVCPNYYDVRDWAFCAQPTNQEVRFLGRLTDCKGLHTVLACAERMPDTLFRICGPGDGKGYASKFQNVVYQPPVQGKERSEFLGDCACVLVPTVFIEPFNGVSAEAQLCGTPVVSTAFGAFLTNVEQGRTGFVTHTLQDIVEAIRFAQAGKFDRKYIRERAVSLWTYEPVAEKYECAFKSIVDVKHGKGWYAEKSHMREFALK